MSLSSSISFHSIDSWRPECLLDASRFHHGNLGYLDLAITHREIGGGIPIYSFRHDQWSSANHSRGRCTSLARCPKQSFEIGTSEDTVEGTLNPSQKVAISCRHTVMCCACRVLSSGVEPGLSAIFRQVASRSAHINHTTSVGISGPVRRSFNNFEPQALDTISGH